MRHTAVLLSAMSLAGACVVAVIASWSVAAAVVVALPLCLVIGLEASLSGGSAEARTATAVDMKAAALGHAPTTHRAEVHHIDQLRAARGRREVVEHEHLAPVVQLVPRTVVQQERLRAHG